MSSFSDARKELQQAEENQGGLAGKVEEARVGGQLGAGDTLRVDKGKAVLIYLSGRSVAVEAGKTHAVQQETGKPSPLTNPAKSTLMS